MKNFSILLIGILFHSTAFCQIGKYPTEVIKKMISIAKDKGMDFTEEQCVNYLANRTEQKDPKFSAEKMGKAYEYAGELGEFTEALSKGELGVGIYLGKKVIAPSSVDTKMQGDVIFNQNKDLIVNEKGLSKEEFDRLPESEKEKIYKDYDSGKMLFKRDDFTGKVSTERKYIDDKGNVVKPEDMPNYGVDLSTMTPAELKKWSQEDLQKQVDENRKKNGIPLKDEEPKPTKFLNKWSVDDDQSKTTEEGKKVFEMEDKPAYVSSPYWGDESAPTKSNIAKPNSGKPNPLNDDGIYTHRSSSSLSNDDFERMNKQINNTADNKNRQLNQSMKNTSAWANNNMAIADRQMQEGKAALAAKQNAQANASGGGEAGCPCFNERLKAAKSRVESSNPTVGYTSQITGKTTQVSFANPCNLYKQSIADLTNALSGCSCDAATVNQVQQMIQAYRTSLSQQGCN